MKARELMTLRRLILNESYNDFLTAEIILTGLEKDLLKKLSHHPNPKIAKEAMKLRVDCMQYFSKLCHSYMKTYEDLIEQTLQLCTGPKADEDSVLNVLDAVTMIPYWTTAYKKARNYTKAVVEATLRLQSKHYMRIKEDIDICALKYHFTQYLNFISYWLGTRHDSEKNALSDINERLRDLANELTESTYIPKKRTTEYDEEGANVYEV
ncbi:MAG: hypothetical protein IKU20_02110 [Lachnospiraceae bacterium]|nr:hypothetical protein [Lachnospiraceae bacterium]